MQKFRWEVYGESGTMNLRIRIFDNDKIQWTSSWSDFEWWFKHEYPAEFHSYCQLDYDSERDNSFLIPEELQKQGIDRIIRDYLYYLQKKDADILTKQQ